MTDDLELYDWHRQWVDGDPAATRKNGSIVLLDRAGPGEGALELLQRAGRAKWTGPALQRRGRTTSRSRRSSSPTNGSSAPERVNQESAMFQTEYEFTLPVRLPRRGRHAAPRRRDAPRHRGRRDPAAEGSARAEEPGLSDRDPARRAWSRGSASLPADQPEGRSRACSPPTSRTCRTSTTGSTRCDDAGGRMSALRQDRCGTDGAVSGRARRGSRRLPPRSTERGGGLHRLPLPLVAASRS